MKNWMRLAVWLRSVAPTEVHWSHGSVKSIHISWLVRGHRVHRSWPKLISSSTKKLSAIRFARSVAKNATKKWRIRSTDLKIYSPAPISHDCEHCSMFAKNSIWTIDWTRGVSSRICPISSPLSSNTIDRGSLKGLARPCWKTIRMDRKSNWTICIRWHVTSSTTRIRAINVCPSVSTTALISWRMKVGMHRHRAVAFANGSIKRVPNSVGIKRPVPTCNHSARVSPSLCIGNCALVRMVHSKQWFLILFDLCIFNLRSTDFSFTNDTMEEHIQRKNALYGALRPSVTKVFSTHGTIDPWHRMGILTSQNPHSPVAVIPGASHVNDFRAIQWDKDSREMLFAKVTIRNLVKEWLKL